MPLIFKLVGFNKQIISTFQGLINITHIQNEFKKAGLSDDVIEKLKFITDRTVISDVDKTFHIKEDEENIMFIFTDQSIRSTVIEFFDKYGSIPVQMNQEDNSINMPPQVTSPVLKMTEETIIEANKTAEKILADKDLMTLFDIYLRRPELFSTFAKYTQHGTIVEDSINTKTIGDLTPEELEHYKALADQITLPISDEIKINSLIKYKGHIKLALRSLISNIGSLP